MIDRSPRPRHVFVIAEAGVNHNGDPRLACDLIDAAVAARADAVKFQTWKLGEQTGKYSFVVDYQRGGGEESGHELLRRLTLPFEAFRKLSAYAKKRGIVFLSTPDGPESLRFLVRDLRVPIVKVSSTEATHPQFLEEIGSYGVPVILSTGMCNLLEVRTAVAALRKSGRPELTILHCTSEYPAPLGEINLLAMLSIRKALRLPVGLSDHSVGNEAAIAATALGACVIEKHFTLDKAMAGPDHKASLNPDELKWFVQSIRDTKLLLGDGVKRMSNSERRNVQGIRRSVVASAPLAKGTVLTRSMLTCKRPGTGLPPSKLDWCIGRRLVRDIDVDEPIKRLDLR